ncbi:MAG: DUF1311 domain-containing protein [Gemmatimonadetes bacterium]|nr:MAG: DUF1311 domain-containing protein [Gemmatimonadota bacterium]
MRVFSLIVIIIILNISSGYADSPLTSTPFYQAYQDVDIVVQARSNRVLSPEIAQFLSDPAKPIDVKAAIINALGWDIEGTSYAVTYKQYLQTKYNLTDDAQLMEKCQADELFCWGYLTALSDYFHPEQALPLLEAAKAKNPTSLTVNLIYTLTVTQGLSVEDWCDRWELPRAVVESTTLTPDLRQPAITIIMDYMQLYEADCSDDPCANAMTQAEMNVCAAEAYDAADAELNRIYQEVRAQLDAEMKAKLTTAQRAWIAFRDAHCDCEAYEFSGGTIYTAIYYGCLTEMTERRIEEIKQLIEEY